MKVNRIKLALQQLSNYAELLETVPRWVCKESERVQVKREADYYLGILKGDRALLEQFELLDRKTANGEEAMAI